MMGRVLEVISPADFTLQPATLRLKNTKNQMAVESSNGAKLNFYSTERQDAANKAECSTR
ncbi:hypothetical protein Z042_18635 [Chania multitudinisentens RB-25]|uniref:Uncharacterized protein n=1 Tax=Chania multitudinisentens RB-25 TaxID=1441930 RepID=W0LLL4_9GAMM|nr:hypothetical protein Z042_18635 [Chania multitudinisentens RB-25]